MTNFEYASRINEAAGLDLSLDCEEIDLQDKLYGLFQCFMPDGSGARAVFAPLQDGFATSSYNTDLRRHGAADARGLFEVILRAISSGHKVALERGEIAVFTR